MLASLIPTLAQIGGSGMVHNLFMILVIGICVALVWVTGRWFIKDVFKATNPNVLTVWTALFVLVGVIVVINFLMSLIDHQFIKW